MAKPILQGWGLDDTAGADELPRCCPELAQSQQFSTFLSKIHYVVWVNFPKQRYVWLESLKLHLKLRKQNKNGLREKKMGGKIKLQDGADFWDHSTGWASLPPPLECQCDKIWTPSYTECFSGKLRISIKLFHDLMQLQSAMLFMILVNLTCIYHQQFKRISNLLL